MSLRLLMDVHINAAVTEGLRKRGVALLTAQEDDSRNLNDPDLLDRAGVLGRVLFTQDDDLLHEGVHRQRSSVWFAGIIYAHQLRVTIGQCVSDLELMASVLDPEDMENLIEFLPLR